MGSLSPYGQSEVENKSSAYLKVVELNNSMSIEKENSVMKNNIEQCFVVEKVEKYRHLRIFLYNKRSLFRFQSTSH